MKDGKIVEQGAGRARVHRAASIPIRARCSPPSRRPDPAPPQPDAPVLLKTDQLKVWFPITRGLLRKVVGHVKAVDGVTIELRKGETLGVVGESGSGKIDAWACAILRLISSEGPIVYMGTRSARPELQGDAAVPPRHADRVPGPLRLAVAAHVGRRDHQGRPQGPPAATCPIAERDERVVQALARRRPRSGDHASAFRMNFPAASASASRWRARVVLEPSFIVLDEPTSALDMVIQAQMVDLLRDLQKRHNLTYLFISHDLRVVARAGEPPGGDAAWSRGRGRRRRRTVPQSQDRLYPRAVCRRVQPRNRAGGRRRAIILPGLAACGYQPMTQTSSIIRLHDCRSRSH